MRDSLFSRRVRGVLPCLGAVTTMACASTGGGPADPAWLAEAGAFDLDGSALVIHSGGWDELFSDPRDAGLRQALALLDERLLELPDEFGGGAPPPGTVEFLCEALSVPWTLRVDLDGTGPLAVRAQWSFEAASTERASALAAHFAGLVALVGLPTTSAQGRPGLSQVVTPVGSLFHGAPAGGTTFLLAWGGPPEHARELGTAGLPAGIRPAFALGFDVGAFLEWIEEVVPEEVDEGHELGEVLDFFGLEEVPVCMTWASGHGTDRIHIASRNANWAAVAAKTGALAAGPIPREALELVPGDATVVSISRGEPTMLLRVLAKVSETHPDAPAQLEDALGIELGPDLLEPLGQTFGFYLSDSTGGGDLMSSVAFAEVDDAARLSGTLDALAARLSDMAAGEAEGRVHLRRFEHGGALGYELDFPGLPIPLSPSLALSAGHLFLAATPQALAAALDQAGGEAQPASRSAPNWLRELSSARLGATDDLQALLYLDAPRLARSGYGYAALLASSIANGLRSPTDPARQPGLVLPPFRELLANVQPTVMLSRVQGQDLVTVGSGDRSALVHLAAALHWAPTLFSALGLAGGLAEIGKNLENEESDEDAETIQAEEDIWSMRDALEGHAGEHDGQYPESLEALLEPDEEGLAWLAEIPLDPWGNPYFYALEDGVPRIYSLGADGLPGGEGAEADVDSQAIWSEEDSFDPGDEGWMDEDEMEEDDMAEDDMAEDDAEELEDDE